MRSSHPGKKNQTKRKHTHPHCVVSVNSPFLSSTSFRLKVAHDLFLVLYLLTTQKGRLQRGRRSGSPVSPSTARLGVRSRALRGRFACRGLDAAWRRSLRRPRATPVLVGAPSFTGSEGRFGPSAARRFSAASRTAGPGRGPGRLPWCLVR